MPFSAHAANQQQVESAWRVAREEVYHSSSPSVGTSNSKSFSACNIGQFSQPALMDGEADGEACSTNLSAGQQLHATTSNSSRTHRRKQGHCCRHGRRRKGVDPEQPASKRVAKVNDKVSRPVTLLPPYETLWTGPPEAPEHTPRCNGSHCLQTSSLIEGLPMPRSRFDAYWRLLGNDHQAKASYGFTVIRNPEPKRPRLKARKRMAAEKRLAGAVATGTEKPSEVDLLTIPQAISHPLETSSLWCQSSSPGYTEVIACSNSDNSSRRSENMSPSSVAVQAISHAQDGDKRINDDDLEQHCPADTPVVASDVFVVQGEKSGALLTVEHDYMSDSSCSDAPCSPAGSIQSQAIQRSNGNDNAENSSPRSSQLDPTSNMAAHDKEMESQREIQPAENQPTGKSSGQNRSVVLLTKQSVDQLNTSDSNNPPNLRKQSSMTLPEGARNTQPRLQAPNVPVPSGGNGNGIHAYFSIPLSHCFPGGFPAYSRLPHVTAGQHIPAIPNMAHMMPHGNYFPGSHPGSVPGPALGDILHNPAAAFLASNSQFTARAHRYAGFLPSSPHQ